MQQDYWLPFSYHHGVINEYAQGTHDLFSYHLHLIHLEQLIVQKEKLIGGEHESLKVDDGENCSLKDAL